MTTQELETAIHNQIAKIPKSKLNDALSFLQQFSKEEKPTSPQGLGGLWNGAVFTDEDIAQARDEMWGHAGEKEA